MRLQPPVPSSAAERVLLLGVHGGAAVVAVLRRGDGGGVREVLAAVGDDGGGGGRALLEVQSHGTSAKRNLRLLLAPRKQINSSKSFLGSPIIWFGRHM